MHLFKKSLFWGCPFVAEWVRQGQKRSGLQQGMSDFCAPLVLLIEEKFVQSLQTDVGNGIWVGFSFINRHSNNFISPILICISLLP